MSLKKQTRKSLSLQEKVAIIRLVEGGKSHNEVSKEKGVTRQCVSKIWAKRLEILKHFERGNPNSLRSRRPKFEMIDAALLKWFSIQRDKKIPIGGPLLLEKAKMIAEDLQISDFQASAGWLDKWKKRHGITFKVVSGESASVNLDNVHEWFSDKWETIAGQYSPSNIFNCDETGLFWPLWSLPDKTHAFKNETCSGGKMSKERITVLLACNMDGSEKLNPFVIGKSQKPRAFKRLHSNEKLPVRYAANKTAWMTSQLFVEWLQSVDNQMQIQRRQILLILDNCPSHPNPVLLKNIKLLFLPPNATSVCQPLDQGIIQNFKLKYRASLLRKIILQLETDDTKVWSIDILDAILLLTKAWKEVKQSCMANCFRKSGFKFGESVLEAEEPEESLPLQEYAMAAGIEITISQEEYLMVDDLVATSEIPSEAEILLSVNPTESEQLPEEEEEDYSSDEVSMIDQFKRDITRSEMLSSLQTVKSYLLQQAEPSYEDINFVMSLEDRVFYQRETGKKQTLVTDFFNPVN